MRQTVTTDEGLETEFHIGKSNDRIVLTIVITNTSDEPITKQSGMGKWGMIGLRDDSDLSRLESIGSTAVVTPWTIDPDHSIIYSRETATPSEAEEQWEQLESFLDVEFVTSPEEYRSLSETEDVEFAPNVNIPKESDTLFIATAGAFDVSMQAQFYPHALPEPLDRSEYTFMEQSTESYSFNFEE